MNKKLIIILSFIAISWLAIIFITIRINDSKTNNFALKNSLVSPTVAPTIMDDLDAYATSSTEPDIFMTVISQADLIEAYDDYEKLISNSEVIAFGTVNNIESYMNGTRIFSKFNFNVQSVEKGNINVNDMISVEAIGGKLTYSEYLNANRDYLVTKTSSKYISEEEKQHGHEYVESIFMGVPNVKEGDQLLLFLRKSEDFYNIVGTSYYGKFYYNEKNDEVYKEIGEEGNEKAPTKKKMLLKKSDFKNKVKQSKTNKK